MATRELLASTSVHSLHSKRSSTSVLEGGMSDFDDIMMKDLLDAGIIDADDMAIMNAPELTGEKEGGSPADSEEENELIRQATELELGLTNPADVTATDTLMLELSDSAVKMEVHRPQLVPLVNQDDYDGPADDEEELHVIDDLEVDREDVYGEFDEEENYEKDAEKVSNAKGEGRQRLKNIYQHEASKPRFAVGKQRISVSQAQLYGLLDKDGQLNLRSSTPLRSVKEMRSGVERLSRTVGPAAVEFEDEETRNLTFQPKRSAQATAAMKNKRCGYDFMDRLNSRGDFLDRVTPDVGKKKKLAQSQYDALKLDYDAQLDKLQCPQCLKPQSFDEHLENRRVCTACQVKFEKLNITSGLAFLDKVRRKEEERVTRLQRVEKEMYGDSSKSTVVNKIFAAKGVSVMGNSGKTALPDIAQRRPKSASSAPSTHSATPTQTHPTPPLAIGPPKGDQAPPPKSSKHQISGANGPKAAVDKMVSLNSNQAQQLNYVLDGLAKYPGIGVQVQTDSSAKRPAPRPGPGAGPRPGNPARSQSATSRTAEEKIKQLVQL